jgi:hypothetical protein
MKQLFLVLIVSFALVMAHNFNWAYADDLALSKLAGTYSSAGQASITLCFQPDFTSTEACSTAGAVPIVFNDPLVGSFTQDKTGNICGTSTDVLSAPGGVTPPTITVQNTVDTVTKYDPSTATGVISFRNYTGGECSGSHFNSTGATLNNQGTLYFVTSNGGHRRDFVATSLTDSTGDIGAFNAAGFSLKQK